MEKQITNNIENKNNIISCNTISELPNRNNDFSRVIKRPKYDEDLMEAIRKVQKLSMLMPKKINTPPSILFRDIIGEKICDKSGNLSYVAQNKKKAVLEYYPDSTGKYIKKIQEINFKTGKMLSKMEFQITDDENYTATITIFDGKINNSYTIFKVLKTGVVKSITEFYSKNSFRALVRDTQSFLPQKFVEAKEDENKEFYMEEIVFYDNGQLKSITKNSPHENVSILYEGWVKTINVKKLK